MAKEDGAGKAGSDAGPAGGSTVSLSVLVVDNEAEICELLDTHLSGRGHQVKTLTDPRRAIETLRAGVYHACVLDLMMPEVSGMDLLDQIRRIDQDIGVVIITGKMYDGDTVTAFEDYKVEAFVKKPFELERIDVALKRIADRMNLVPPTREEQMLATVGQTIRDLRKHSNFTLTDVARRTKLSVSLLSQIERAESSASVSSLLKIATALGVTMTDLFGGL